MATTFVDFSKEFDTLNHDDRLKGKGRSHALSLSKHGYTYTF